jgi:hypothetical protein
MAPKQEDRESDEATLCIVVVNARYRGDSGPSIEKVYSYLSAIIGSTFAALWAGIQAAISETEASASASTK